MRSGCSVRHGNCGTWRQAVPFSVRRAAGETVPARFIAPDVNIHSRMWHCRRLTVTASLLILAEPADHG